MLEISFVGKFEKDYKLCQKRGYDVALLKSVIDTLAIPEALPPKNKEHKLTGNFIGKKECHIQPDWSLIYQQTETELLLYRTGTHADLFGM